MFESDIWLKYSEYTVLCQQGGGSGSWVEVKPTNGNGGMTLWCPNETSARQLADAFIACGGVEVFE